MALDDPGIQIAEPGELKTADEPSKIAAKGRGSPKRKWAKRILVGTVFFTLTGWLLGAFLFAKLDRYPAATSRKRFDPAIKASGARWQSLGGTILGWTSRRFAHRLSEGRPIRIGIRQRRFAPTANSHARRGVHQNGSRLRSDEWTLSVLKSYVIYRNRHLTDYVPADYRMEIFGDTVGCPDTHPEIGPYYNRVLNYHAAHDVSYMMIDNPLVSRAGCTSFGAWGPGTSNGHLITGRNFDWEAAEVFSRDRVVVMYKPDQESHSSRLPGRAWLVWSPA